MSLDSYITLVDSLPGYRNFTPELKTPPPQVPMPFNGTYTQEQYARDMLDTFIRRGIDPARVWPQSFNPPDIFQWIKEYPAFGAQAIYLDESGDYGKPHLQPLALCKRLLTNEKVLLISVLMLRGSLVLRLRVSTSSPHLSTTC